MKIEKNFLKSQTNSRNSKKSQKSLKFQKIIPACRTMLIIIFLKVWIKIKISLLTVKEIRVTPFFAIFAKDFLIASERTLGKYIRLKRFHVFQ